MINLAGEIKNSTANGPGLRYVIFTQGCSHEEKCEGCHNTHTWDDKANKLYSINSLTLDIVNELPLITGVTFSGGEPFDQAKELARLALKLKEFNLNIMCYTGYTYEELQNLFLLKDIKYTYMKRLLENVDILIDGKFDINKTENSGLYRGSSNQRMLYLKNGKIIKIE